MMKTIYAISLAALIAVLAAALPAAAQPNQNACFMVCDGSESACNRSCQASTMTTCSAWEENMMGNNDYDGDGVANGSDNCRCLANASQANCDGDIHGDACDSSSATWVKTNRRACKSDKDDHVWGYTVEVTHEDTYEDVSACNRPTKYDIVVFDSYCPYTTSTTYCCRQSVYLEEDLDICPPDKDRNCRADTWP